jgi:hypothetical protein
LLRAIILAAGISAGVAIYFVMSLYVIPQSFQESSRQPEPEAFISGVNLSSQRIGLGETFDISVTGANRGEMADMQIVSVGFPNLTASSEIELLSHDFRQTPLTVDIGDAVGSGYSGAATVSAQYPSIEAFSRPWDEGAQYTVELRVRPQAEGDFVVFVKSVAFPHSWDGAHYPGEGPVDYQQEFVESYSIQVTKS